METQVQAVAERPLTSSSVEGDFDGYLDAIADATAIFREAVDTYLQNGADGACWRHASRISEHLRTLDDMQQKLETGVRSQSVWADLVCQMIDPLTGVDRLLKDMKRQITGFAIESGFSSPGRHVPAHLVPDMQELTDEVCAAVCALVQSHRPSQMWWEAPSIEGRRDVSWHESQADQLSMQLLKKIFGDDTLELKLKLTLAQLVEEIDRVADQAESIDLELGASRLAVLPTGGARDSH